MEDARQASRLDALSGALRAEAIRPMLRSETDNGMMLGGHTFSFVDDAPWPLVAVY